MNDFKINLEGFKRSCTDIDTGNFWEVSDLVLGKIEGNNYLENKEKHVKYLTQYPSVARRKGINISYANLLNLEINLLNSIFINF